MSINPQMFMLYRKDFCVWIITVFVDQFVTTIICHMAVGVNTEAVLFASKVKQYFFLIGAMWLIMVS